MSQTVHRTLVTDIAVSGASWPATTLCGRLVLTTVGVRWPCHASMKWS